MNSWHHHCHPQCMFHHSDMQTHRMDPTMNQDLKTSKITPVSTKLEALHFTIGKLLVFFAGTLTSSSPKKQILFLYKRNQSVQLVKKNCATSMHLPCSQCSPEKPSAQVQLASPLSSTAHVPPFSHLYESHGSEEDPTTAMSSQKVKIKSQLTDRQNHTHIRSLQNNSLINCP